MTGHIANLPENLREGQKKAIEALIDHFGEHDRGILWMCCGSGKTVACAVNIELREQPLTVVFTPYIHLVKQWRDDYLRWLPTTEARFMCVCSENDSPREISSLEEARLLRAGGEVSDEDFAQLVADARGSHGQTQVSTNPEEIAAFLRQGGRKVVFCTYASSEVYGDAQRLADVHANYGVFDEAQWTATGDKDTVSTYALHNINVRIDQRLFTTATVRHYTRDGMAYSMDNERAYGGHVPGDANGNPDPWTIRQAIAHNEVAPYRIVLSFVTDPSFDHRLVQLPPYRDLTADLGDRADPAEVQRLIGQAMALERVKAKYGVRKPLGFYSSVSRARLFTDILNECKNDPEHFPHLSRSDPAVSISTYEPLGERRERIQHLHNSRETEINNSKLFLFGTDENTIDGVLFGDPMTSNVNIVQACGRAQRYVPGKTSTIVVPVMLPYSGDDLETHATQIYPDQIRDAFRYLIDILDSLADMDPLLRDQMFSGNGGSNGNPGIIEFDFPTRFLPEARRAIEVAAWRTINPDTDFIDRLHRDRAALDRYRLEKFPTQSDPIEEAKAAEARAEIKIIPQGQGFDTTATRMKALCRDIGAYYEGEEKECRYNHYVISANRVGHVYQIYGWDKGFILQTNKKAPAKEPGWVSGCEMERHYVGGSIQHKALLQSYAEGKTKELIEEGQSPEAAVIIVDRQFVGVRSPTSGVETLFASPAAVAELTKLGLLRVRDERVPAKEPGWISNGEMRKRYVGGSPEHKKTLQIYTERKTKELIEEGQSPEAAAIMVDRQFVGVRSVTSGWEAICASPAAIADLTEQGLLRPVSEKAPAKESGWISGLEMNIRYIGGVAKHQSLLQSYADGKIKELIEEGQSPEAAAIAVNRQFVGMRTGDGRLETICASPAAIAELIEQRLLRSRNEKAPAKEPGWVSTGDIKKNYIGSYSMNITMLQTYAERKTRELIKQGQSPEAAVIAVDRQFVGIRASVSGPEALCASPAVVTDLIEQGLLRPKDRRPAKPRTPPFSPPSPMHP